TFRAVCLKLHRWAALAAAVFLIVLGLTGGILVFEEDLDHVLHPHLWNVAEEAETRLPWQALLERTQAHYPRQRINGIRMPDDPGQAVEFSLPAGRLAYVDPYTGAILGDRHRDSLPTRTIHRLHTNLLIGEWGSLIVGVCALMLVPLVVSGV